MEDKRISTVLPARFRARGRTCMGKIRNVSQGGLFVGTQAIPPQGESVRVRFRLPDGGTADVSGLVWWSTAQGEGHHRVSGFGLRLIQSNRAYRKALTRMVRAEASRIW
jgi:uncharacterized protein (TIGR02266 family)